MRTPLAGLFWFEGAFCELAKGEWPPAAASTTRVYIRVSDRERHVKLTDKNLLYLCQNSRIDLHRAA